MNALTAVIDGVRGNHEALASLPIELLSAVAVASWALGAMLPWQSLREPDNQ